MFVAPRRAANQASLTIRRLANPLSIIFLCHGDLAPPWLQLKGKGKGRGRIQKGKARKGGGTEKGRRKRCTRLLASHG